MIREDLLEFQYYLDRLSKFMQESYGIDEHVKTFHQLLIQVDDFYNQFLNDINIFNSYNIYQNHNALLDKLGAIFGCYRKFTIPKYSTIYWNVIEGFINIDLEDDDFLIYIKAQIIKQNFEGNREQLQTLYSTYQEGELKEGILPLLFFYLQSPAKNSAECYIYWNTQNGVYSDDLINLFENGFLTIESMGILYHRSVVDMADFLTFVQSINNGSGEIPINPKKNNRFAYKGYNLLTSKPADWDAEYDKYYTLVATLVPSGSEPDWAENTYYELIDDNYILLLAKPSNWNDVYENFYTLVVTENTSNVWQSDTYYENINWGGIFA